VPESTFYFPFLLATRKTDGVLSRILSAKALSLEELDAVFEVPTGAYIRYQNNKVVPFWFKRHILRNKSGELEPMVLEQSSSPASLI
jgi:hypothetical protein